MKVDPTHRLAVLMLALAASSAAHAQRDARAQARFEAAYERQVLADQAERCQRGPRDPAIYIGQRYQQAFACHTGLAFITRRHQAGGVVDVYGEGPVTVWFQGGRVVAFTRP